MAGSNLEMAGDVLRDDHLLGLCLVHEGHQVVPLFVRDDDLVPLEIQCSSISVTSNLI